METVNDLKNDIASKERLLKIQQQQIKKQIDDGMFEGAEEILENPETKNYYQQAMTFLEKEENKDFQTKETNNESFWYKIKENFKKIILK